MSNIKVSPEKLRQYAEYLIQEMDVFKEQENRIEEIISELRNDWEGKSSEIFLQKWESIKENYINNTMRSMDEMSSQLNAIADWLEEADQEIANRLGAIDQNEEY